jgi:hypothetical protein
MRNPIFNILKESTKQSLLAAGITFFAHSSEKVINRAKHKIGQLMRPGSPGPESSETAQTMIKSIK